MIGKQFNPYLLQIEEILWNFESNNVGKPEYELEGFRAICKIFMSAMMDKMWDLQESDEMALEDRAAMAEKCGREVRNLIKTYTNIDTTTLYK